MEFKDLSSASYIPEMMPQKYNNNKITSEISNGKYKNSRIVLWTATGYLIIMKMSQWEKFPHIMLNVNKFNGLLWSSQMNMKKIGPEKTEKHTHTMITHNEGKSAWVAQ